MDLKNMQLSKSESEDAVAAPKPQDGPRYPWGLRLTLSDETIDKLGFKDMPAVGQAFMVYARATVTSASQSEELDGDKRRNFDLQITDLACVAEGGGPSAAQQLYGKGDKT